MCRHRGASRKKQGRIARCAKRATRSLRFVHADRVVTGIGIVADRSEMPPERIFSYAIGDVLSRSGLTIKKHNCAHIGLFIGATFINYYCRKIFIDDYQRGGIRSVRPSAFPETLLSYPGAQAGIRLNIKGVNSTISSGISAGLDALLSALYFLARDEKNKALVVGVDEAVAGAPHVRINGGICLLLENAGCLRRAKRRILAHIIDIDSFYERQGGHAGLVKSIKALAERNPATIQGIDAVFTSSLLRSDDFFLEKRAFEKCLVGLREQVPPLHHRSKRVPLFSGLWPFCYVPAHPGILPAIPLANVMFLHRGDNSNSSCMTVRCSLCKGISRER